MHACADPGVPSVAARGRGRDENLLTRRVIRECAPPTPECLYGNVPNLDIATAIKIAKDKVKVKKLWLSKRC